MAEFYFHRGDLSTFPKIVIHADWSLAPQKRWLVRAEQRPDGSYVVHAPQRVPELNVWRAQLAAVDGPVLLGLDIPIGLPLAYARQIDCPDFISWLRQLRPDDLFYQVAEEADEISLQRPFYPYRAGGRRQQQLLDGLGVTDINQLRRRCDLPTATRRAAAPLFWTMGAQQVGKAALTGWRELLVPILQDDGVKAAVWPFAGELFALLESYHLIFAEAYPAEFYHHVGVAFQAVRGRKWGKRVQTDRQANAAVLLEWAAVNQVAIAPEMHQQLLAGFGSSPTAEDQFDAAVGCLGMLNVLLGHRAAGEPAEEEVCRVEGWILGLGGEGMREKG